VAALRALDGARRDPLRRGMRHLLAKASTNGERRFVAGSSMFATVLALSMAFAGAARAQQLPPAAPATPPPLTQLGPSKPLPAEPDPLGDALRPVPGGLTPDDAAKAAAVTRASVRIKFAELKEAQAKVDEAFVAFFPKVTLAAQAVHLSYVNNTFPGASLGTQNTPATPVPATVGPCAKGSSTLCVLDQTGSPMVINQFKIPLVQDQYAITGAVNVPVSDYLLRLAQGYAAASHGESGKRLAADAEALGASVDGRIAFLNWVHGRGQTVVTHQSVEAARAHVVDAKHAFDAGLVSRADVLRLESQVASAEQVEAQAQALEAVAAEQLRVTLGAPPDKPLSLGTDILHDNTTLPPEDLLALNEQALKKRLEIRALDETIHSLRRIEDVTAAGYLPRIDAFADGLLGNPNPRYFFQQQKWDFTWEIGARLSWTLNDTFTAIGQVNEAKARTRQVVEQRAQIRDALRVEVASAASDAARAVVTLDAAERGIAAAEESLRVRRELFKNGKATSVDLIDAENEATRARLARLDAHIGMLVAKARLDHAVGRDVK
jgi:outer membrane protein TolC